MASPAAGSSPTSRPDIGQTVWEFPTLLDSLGLIGHLVLPIKRVRVQSNSYGVIPIEAILNNPNTLRNAKASYNEVDWKFETGSYATIDRGLKSRVDAREEMLYANYFEAEVATTEILELQMAIDYERRVAAKVFNTTTWTGSSLTTAVSIPWSTHATAVPITNITAAKNKVWLLSGQYPDTMICTQDIIDNLMMTAQIVDRVKYQGFMDVRVGNIPLQALAQALGLRKIIVAGAPKNTAIEGQPVVIAPVWDRTMAMICKTSDTDNMMMPSIGRTFLWDQRSGDFGAAGLDVMTYADPDGETSWVRVRHDSDEKIIRPQCGHLLTTVIA